MIEPGTESPDLMAARLAAIRAELREPNATPGEESPDLMAARLERTRAELRELDRRRR